MLASGVGVIESGRFLVGAVRAHPDAAERAPEAGAHEAGGLLCRARAHVALEARPRFVNGRLIDSSHKLTSLNVLMTL